jgi:hypothetical protein
MSRHDYLAAAAVVLMLGAMIGDAVRPGPAWESPWWVSAAVLTAAALAFAWVWAWERDFRSGGDHDEA